MPRFLAAVITALLLMPTLSRAELVTKAVDYTHDGVALQGWLVFDDAVKGKRPGVLVVHEWWGHNDYARSRAEAFAKEGYVAFALDMYGTGKLGTNPEQALKLAGPFYQDRALMRARAAAGLKILADHEMTDKARLAAVGYCFGGTVALELARSGADLAAVVSFHGGLATPKPDDNKNIKAAVLICHGSADPMVPPAEVTAFMQSADQHKVDATLIAYSGALHAFTNKAADAVAKAGLEGVGYDPDADRRSWKHAGIHLQEAFANPK